MAPPAEAMIARYPQGASDGSASFRITSYEGEQSSAKPTRACSGRVAVVTSAGTATRVEPSHEFTSLTQAAGRSLVDRRSHNAGKFKRTGGIADVAWG